MIIEGKNIELFVWDEDDSVWLNIYCSIRSSLNVEAETVVITTIDSGREDEYDGGATNATIDFNGGIALDFLGGWMYENFVDEIGNKHRFLFQMTNSFGDVLSYDMQGIITNVNGGGGVGEHGLFDLSILRSGPMTKIKTYNGALVDSEDNYILDSKGQIIRG